MAYVKFGTFTGNSTNPRPITGVGFEADLVVVKNIQDNFDTWFKTKEMPATFSLPIRSDSSGDTNHIIAIGSDGFTVSADAAVNNNTRKIVWMAVKDDGNGDFCTFSWVGDNTDNKQVNTAVGNLDFILGKGNTGIVGASRFATAENSVIGETAMNFGGGANRSDLINTINALGFTISNGDSSGGNLLQQNGVTHYGFGFKNRAGFIHQGTIAGNNANPRSITDPNFEPGFLFLRGRGGQSPVVKFKDNATNGTQAWDNSEGTSNITGFISNGFTVTNTGDVNQSSNDYDYIAIKENPFSGGVASTFVPQISIFLN